MPSYAPSFTPRYRLHYLNVGVQHSVTVRFARGTSFSSVETQAIAAWEAIFTALDALTGTDLAAISAEIALTDSEVFNPAAIPTLDAGPVVPGDVSAVNKVLAWTWS